MRISGTDIYIAKGDTANLTLSFEEEQNKNEIHYEIWFSNGENIDGIIQENSKNVLFTIETEEFSIGTHYYDIIAIKTDSLEESEDEDISETLTTTIIRKSLFVVEETARTMNQPTYTCTGSNN